MTSIKNKLLPLSGLVILSGCANFTLPELPKPLAPVAVKESVSQICKATEENQVRATGYYSGKTLTITGEVLSVTERFNPRYRIYLMAGKTHIHAGTENQSYAMKLTNGQQASVTGIIEGVSYNYRGCAISLKDAKF